MNIGSTIYKLRTAKNLSQEELAERLDVSRQSVSKWETDASVPDLDKLVKLCEIFEITLDELVGRVPKEEVEEEPTSSPPPQPQVIVQQVPSKDSFFTINKIFGCVLLLGAMFATLLTRSSRIFLTVSVPLCIMAINHLVELRNPWLGCALWIYLWKNFEIPRLIDLWIGADSVTGKIAWIFIIIAVSVTTCIIAVRFYKKYITEATVSAKYDRAILVILGWLAYFACIAFYALTVAGRITIGNEFTWLVLALYSCLAMVYYTTAYLVYRKKTQ